jgi:hypothetical protein
MIRNTTPETLSSPRRRLLQICLELHFGRIEQLVIRKGEPIFDPPPRIVKEIKFAAENGPRMGSHQKDALNKQQIRDLWLQLDQLQNCVIDYLEIKHSIPFKLEVQTEWK